MMRRHFVRFALVLTICSILWPGLHGRAAKLAVPPGTSLEVRRATLAPPFDGDLSEWVNIPAATLDTSNASYYQGVITSPADASLSLKSVWTPSTLYFAIHVNDDRLVVNPQGEIGPPYHPYWMDEIEIGINAFADRRSYANHQFTLNPDGFRTDSSLALASFQVITRSVVGGWDAEVALPVQNLDVSSLQGGSGLNFTFSYHDADGDNPGYYDGFIIWAGQQTNGAAADWGMLALSNTVADFSAATAATAVTASPAATVTPMPTATATPSSTLMPSATPSATFSATATPTSSATLVPTPTWTASPSVTPSTGDIRGTVWNDPDGNGQREVGERGLANVPVTLYDAAGTLLDSTVSQSDGHYAFSGRAPGVYRVQVTLAAGYSATTPTQVTIYLPANQTVTLDFGGTLTPTPVPTAVPRLDIGSAQSIACNSQVSSTTLGHAAHVSSYACKPAWAEDGPEAVFKVTLLTPAPVQAHINHRAGNVDLDLFLLDSADPNSCRIGADEAFSITLSAGDYYLAVDGFQGAAGPFTLGVSCGAGTPVATLTPALSHQIYLPVGFRSLPAAFQLP